MERSELQIFTHVHPNAGTAFVGKYFLLTEIYRVSQFRVDSRTFLSQECTGVASPNDPDGFS